MRHLLLLVCLSSLLILPNLTGSVVERIQEIRVLSPARLMAEGGSWLIPRFQDEPRLRKPPAMYWMVATAFVLAGDTDSAFVARLPAFVNATLMLLVIAGAGARLVGRRRAMLAALIAATSMVFLRHAMLAETDMPVSMLTALTILMLYRAITGPPSAWAWLLVGGCSGLGFLFKGPAAIALPLLVFIVHGIVSPQHRRALWQRRALLAPVMFALLALPWYLAVYLLPEGRAALQGSIQGELQNTFLDATHEGSLFYYFPRLPAQMLPWGLLLPPALWLVARQCRRHLRVRFLLTWFCVAFLALSFTVQKQPHYMCLLLPPSALVLAQFLAHGRRLCRHWPARLCRGLTTGLAAVLAVAGLVGAGAAMVGPAPVSPAAMPIGLLLTLLAVLALRRWPRVPLLGRMILLAVLLAPAAWLTVELHESRGEMDLALRRFLLAAGADVRQAPQALVVGPHQHVFDWHLHRHLRPADSLQQAWQMAAPGDAILASDNHRSQLDRDSLPEPPHVEVAEGRLTLFLYVKR